MDDEFIFVDVYLDYEDKYTRWYLDVSLLTLESLINLRSELRGTNSVSSIDLIINQRACDASFLSSYRSYLEDRKDWENNYMHVPRARKRSEKRAKKRKKVR